MKTRITVGAFLICKDKVLLIKRGMHKKLAPGLWGGVGGHMEPHEMNNPIATAYREIEEEAGISPNDIFDLKLRYMAVRNRIGDGDDEISTMYYYTGNVSSEVELPECDEGILHWIYLKDAVDLPMSFSVKQILTHWLSNTEKTEVFLLGVNKDNNGVTFVEL